MLNKISIFDNHRKTADRQRKKYNFDKQNLKNDQLLIELDWKQKIIIGNNIRLLLFNFFFKFSFIKEPVEDK